MQNEIRPKLLRRLHLPGAKGISVFTWALGAQIVHGPWAQSCLNPALEGGRHLKEEIQMYIRYSKKYGIPYDPIGINQHASRLDNPQVFALK